MAGGGGWGVKKNEYFLTWKGTLLRADVAGVHLPVNSGALRDYSTGDSSPLFNGIGPWDVLDFTLVTTVLF